MSFQKKNDPMNIVLKYHQCKACYTRHDFGGKRITGALLRRPAALYID